MNENPLVKFTMTYGLYLGIAFSVVVIIMKFAGITHHPGDSAGMINAILLSFGMMFFGKKYRDTIHEGLFLYKNALSFSVLLTLFSAIIYTFFSYFYYSSIEPSGISFYIEQMSLAYAQSGNFTDEQITALVELYNNMLTPTMMAFIVFFSQALIGVLVGLIMAVFIKSPASLEHNKF